MEYIEKFGKRYVKCTSCKYGNNGNCVLFGCSYSSDDGCTEQFIADGEKRAEEYIEEFGVGGKKK